MGPFALRGSILIIASFPCRQLTWAGVGDGVLSLNGRDSTRFSVAPTIAAVVIALRPDAVVKQQLQSMVNQRRPTIKPFRIEAAAWAPLPRIRLCATSIPLDVRDRARQLGQALGIPGGSAAG